MNFRGPLRIEFRAVMDDGEDGEWGVGRFEPRFSATSVGGEEVEVDLRVGRGGIVYALPVDQSPEPEPIELPPNEELHPVPPEARTTPVDLGEFTNHE